MLSLATYLNDSLCDQFVSVDVSNIMILTVTALSLLVRAVLKT